MTTRRSFFLWLSMPAAFFLLGALTPIYAQPSKGGLTGGHGGPSGVIQNPRDIIQPDTAYFIKSKGSQKVLDVTGGSVQPGAVIQQLTLNGNFGQKFIFTDAGGGFFFIRSTSGLFVTLRTGQVISQPGKPPVPDEFLTQEPLAKNTPLFNAQNAQQWKVIESGEPTCFFIVNKTKETRALQPANSSNNAGIATAPRDGNNLQKWILKATTTLTKPDPALVENGLVSDCFETLQAFLFVKYKKNLSQAFPEWRSVGETFLPDGVTRGPLHAYQILEGVVDRSAVRVAPEDLPSTHFTHDFNFKVLPDPPFQHLLSRPTKVSDVKLDTDGNPDGIFNQRLVEVEWESGLAQADNRDVNPASAASIRGDSFGFYSAGHRRRDPIWNWPTTDDWVHVEGVWIFDRGHEPVVTEIHPPHFVAVRRSLPDKFEPEPGKFFIATRADLYANGDGNIVWNNKGIHPFAQPVKMSERAYSVIIKHDIPRPTPNAKLNFALPKQNGDSYTGQPRVTIFENGTPDEPTPHVLVTIAWAADNVPDTAVFGRTLFVYWDDLPTHGVPPGFPLKRMVVTLNNVVIQDKQEGRASADVGEYRLFADIGGRWLFLNEFTGATDVLAEGLGDAWDIFVPNTFPKPRKAEHTFNFNQTFEFFIPAGKTLRVAAGGWEGDYMENQYGKIANPFLSCAEAKRFLNDNFDLGDYATGGKLDDSVGEAITFIPFSRTRSRPFSVESAGPVKDEAGDENDPNKAFRLNFRVTVTAAPFSQSGLRAGARRNR